MSIQGISSAYSAYKAQADSLSSINNLQSFSSEDDTSSATNSTKDKNLIKDTVLISLEAKQSYIKDKLQQQENDKESSQKIDLANPTKNLTTEEKKSLEKLQSTDAEVKAHEKAHENAASGIGASNPSYTYKVGPDGNKYAVAGEVHVSYQATGDAETDEKKAKAMESSALAPESPSSADLSVASKADSSIAEAKKNIKSEQESTSDSDSDDSIG